jgi:hypothetical protein
MHEGYGTHARAPVELLKLNALGSDRISTPQLALPLDDEEYIKEIGARNGSNVLCDGFHRRPPSSLSRADVFAEKERFSMENYMIIQKSGVVVKRAEKC